MRVWNLLAIVCLGIGITGAPRTYEALRREVDELRIENAQQKLRIASLRSEVEDLSAKLEACKGETDPNESRDDDPRWRSAISLVVVDIESTGLLLSEELEIESLGGDLDRLRDEFEGAKKYLARLERENRNARHTQNRPYSKQAVSEARVEAQRLENEIRRKEQDLRRLERAKSETRVIVRCTHPEQVSLEYRVLFTDRWAIEAMSLKAGDEIEAIMSPRATLAADDLVEARAFRVKADESPASTSSGRP